MVFKRTRLNGLGLFEFEMTLQLACRLFEEADASAMNIAFCALEIFRTFRTHDARFECAVCELRLGTNWIKGWQCREEVRSENVPKVTKECLVESCSDKGRWFPSQKRPRRSAWELRWSRVQNWLLLKWAHKTRWRKGLRRCQAGLNESSWKPPQTLSCLCGVFYCLVVVELVKQRLASSCLGEQTGGGVGVFSILYSKMLSTPSLSSSRSPSMGFSLMSRSFPRAYAFSILFSCVTSRQGLIPSYSPAINPSSWASNRLQFWSSQSEPLTSASMTRASISLTNELDFISQQDSKTVILSTSRAAV